LFIADNRQSVMQSSIDTTIFNRQSGDRHSTIINLSIGTRHSAFGNGDA